MSSKEYNETMGQVEEAIKQLRPFLNADGGDIKLLRIEDNIAKVKLLGACHDCDMSAMTLKAGVEEAVKRAVPTIVAIEAVEE